MQQITLVPLAEIAKALKITTKEALERIPDNLLHQRQVDVFGYIDHLAQQLEPFESWIFDRKTNEANNLATQLSLGKTPPIPDDVVVSIREYVGEKCTRDEIIGAMLLPSRPPKSTVARHHKPGESIRVRVWLA